MHSLRRIALGAALVNLVGCGASLPAATARRAEPPPVIAAEEPPPAPAALPFRMPCGDSDLVACTNGCNDKQTEDCVTLASMYLSGALVSPDRPRAIQLFRAACDEGSARGCMRLGDAYHAGLLAGAEEELACYQKACDGGANLGCVAAGRAYLSGRGVAADAAHAAMLFGRVCDRGNAPACLELGRLYQRGEGVKKSAERSADLYLKACKLGLDEGCLRAGKGGPALPPRD